MKQIITFVLLAVKLILALVLAGLKLFFQVAYLLVCNVEAMLLPEKKPEQAPKEELEKAFSEQQ